MKIIKHILVVAGIAILLFTSCNRYPCHKFTFTNSSDHTISLLRYRANKLMPEQSFHALPPGGRHKLPEFFCADFTVGAPFRSDFTTSDDSVVVVFNDTLRVLIVLALQFRNDPYDPFPFGPKYPALRDNWARVKTQGDFVFFEYDFTNWHFEWAIENQRR